MQSDFQVTTTDTQIVTHQQRIHTQYNNDARWMVSCLLWVLCKDHDHVYNRLGLTGRLLSSFAEVSAATGLLARCPGQD